MSKYKHFYYAEPFSAVRDYLNQMGHTLIPVYSQETLQYHKVKDTQIVIIEETYYRNPATGDYSTTMRAEVQLMWTLDRNTYKRVYNQDDVRLYENLKRRFDKSNNTPT
jgi:hypothetical protein